ncbi:hypothetical protein GALMADRAFT_226445 [Galerina marginata CBS 339.88]|uniref:Essential protein Yae1 N-terminal domain-containing protein n=1 Tax=Galerina marginata (strain CBS 339.88) TaxID=685588 RepID=A0A067SY23_GALM3|nr:hypothetical protein GALMADRAFT_226445 [Galerina marginata CBS 339.88]
MPAENKPLPPIEDEVVDYLSPNIDLVAQVREATYSPSPLIRILQDPSILPTESADNGKKERRRPSRSPRRREHRSPMVAAIAIAEEERQAKHLKALLRSSGDRLEHEMRRADDATARAEWAERREREALERTKAAEAAKQEMHIESMRLERDIRNYQLQLEAAQIETRRLQDDLADARREVEELDRAEAKAQQSLHKYRVAMHDSETQMQERTAEIYRMADNYYEDGREDGYDEGYDKGYEDGRKTGVREGVKKGRNEGVKEGREQGRQEERRNALEAFDKFLAQDNDDHHSEKTRRWAQSIYRAEVDSGYSESLDPSDSGSQQ